MIIAVNTRLQKNEQPEGYNRYLFEILDRLTKIFPQHQYLLLFDKPPAGEWHFEKNVLPIIAGPDTRNSLRLQYWFNFKVPALLRKHKADVLVSLEGICSQRTRKPQCLLFCDLSFLQPAHKSAKARFYKKFTATFLHKAKTICAVSPYTGSQLASHYGIEKDTITIIPPGISQQFKPLGWEEKETVKDHYADGKAYFLYQGIVSEQANLINLLKAFSLFKKRQRSNMLLLLAGEADEKFKKELSTYRLRNDVRLLEHLTLAQLAEVTGAAYALVHPVRYTDLALAPLQALKCNVPIIASNTGASPSLLEDAALYIDPENVTNLAENMMLVFKNEDRARALTEAGRKLLNRYDWDKSANLLMQAIEKAVES